ncbi:MAG: hypothetical protein EOO77_13135 [Oxalobacteraceae bacterium]|nr:MAG: hypothetical protein EOO77_13135 [Oxalobacteraceae bacterium]
MMPCEHTRYGTENSTDWRRSCRALINLPIVMTTPSREVLPACLADISTGGCKVRSAYAVAPGRFVTIDIPEFASYSGWVAWENGIEFGLDLSNPIPVGVVQHVLTLAQKRAENEATWFKTLLSKGSPMYISNHAKPKL